MRAVVATEKLPVVHTVVDNLEPERFVRSLRCLVVVPGIGREFDAPLAPSPLLSPVHERPADSLTRELGIHIPPFEITARLRWVTAIGVGPETNLGKSDETRLMLGHENREWQRATWVTGQDGMSIRTMLI